MKLSRWAVLAPCASLVSLSAAEDAVYVTDLTIFTLLAPCAQDAVSGVIGAMTSGSCGDAASELQSCVCSADNNHDDVLASMSTSVSRRCGESASDDHASVTSVFDKYCDPGADIDFATPTDNVVEQYPTDIEAFHELAPCAQYGVSLGMQEMTDLLCPEPASLLAPCLCGKNENSLKASQTIASSVKQDCSNDQDVTSAQGFLSAYCAMTAGTTSFPEPSTPPGDMTYYISALPQYSSLAPCAQSGINEALYEHSSSLCPEGPQVFAGCACMKGSLSSIATSRISSSVRWVCDAAATAEVESAIDVWDFYCSAANDEVTATGLAAPEETAGAGSGSGIGGGAIAGAVVGGVVGVAAIVAAIWFFYRRKALRKQSAAGSKPEPYYGKPELADHQVVSALPSPSPLSTHGSPRSGPKLHHGSSAELSGARPVQELSGVGQTQELPGQASTPRPELHGAPVHGAAAPQQSPQVDAQGMSWQSGPVAGYR